MNALTLQIDEGDGWYTLNRRGVWDDDSHAAANRSLTQIMYRWISNGHQFEPCATYRIISENHHDG